MRHSTITAVLSFVIFMLAGCAESDTPPATEESVGTEPAIVEITARALTFDAPSEIRSGWNRIRFDNRSDMVHFALLERLPDGVTIDDQQRDVAPSFQTGMDRLSVGNEEAAMEAFGELPEWFGEVDFKGGPGLVSGGGWGETIVYLEPGTYMVECYVKTNGVFHSYNPDPQTMGMVAEIRVTEELSNVIEPDPTAELTISSDSGIVFADGLEPGDHTIAVRFEDQVQHENFVGHDVHLARIDATTDLESLGEWMDWTRPAGLQTPSPVEFIGGTNELPAGETAYVRVVLEPGRYVWISEVPNPGEKGMMVEFEVGPVM